ncbi:CRISPR-associated protein Csx18 [Trichormus azollae]|uniref:CRISPR-associated protein Csx18 n=1 Tax=Trichormus azollae TaxID=1164 RepID=UPI00325CC095
MSLSVAKRLVHYRSWLVAVVNGGITWIVLIIAPLGLLAVIIYTLSLLLGSLMVSHLGQRDGIIG